MDTTIFKTTKYVTNGLFIKKALELGLSLEEFLVLTYFDNDNSFLDIERMSHNLNMKLEDALKAFNTLVSKQIVMIKTTKDIEGRMIEKVSLDSFYQMIMMGEKEVEKEEVKTDIYSEFEKGFGRTLNSMEYEIINAWIEKGFSEELIKRALKEAVYHDVKKLNYIDKILFEWHKKGYVSKEDVDSRNKRDSKEIEGKELFDYNWLDDEE